MVSKYDLNDPPEWLQRMFLMDAVLKFSNAIATSNGKRSNRNVLPDNVIDLIGQLAGMPVVPDRQY